MPESKAQIARQPVLDARGKTFGYELLYRSVRGAARDDVEKTKATLASALIDIGLDALVGEGKAFLNVNEELLYSECLELLPPGRVVLEILETSEPTERILKGMSRLIAKGYTFALDDYCGQPHLEPFLDLVRIVKLETPEFNDSHSLGQLQKLRNQGLKLLAEKVETQKEASLWKKLGASYFQGFFFAKPQLLTKESTASANWTALRLLAQLQNPDADVKEITRTVSTDAALTYRLLKYVNNASNGLAKPVSDVMQAVQILGLKKLTAVAALLILSEASERPEEVLRLAVIRARTCELLGKIYLQGEPSHYYTTGLLSFLDVMLGVPMDTILDQLPLVEPVKEALRNPFSECSLRMALNNAISLEHNEDDLEVDLQAHAEAVTWSFDLFKAA